MATPQTPTAIYNQIREMSFDNDQALVSESELYQYMSDAELILAKEIPFTETTLTDNTVVDQREYDRPTNALKIKRVTWNTVKLKKISMGDVDVIEGQSYGGITSTGNLIYYYEYGNKIGFSPLPKEVQEIKYWLLLYPAALSSESTTFTIPPEYAHYIPDYCLWRLFVKDEKAGLADRHLNMWLSNRKEAAKDWMMRQSTDEIETVQLEEIYNTSEMGMI